MRARAHKGRKAWRSVAGRGGGSSHALRHRNTCVFAPLPPAPSCAGKYLKAEAKPSDVPEFLRQFQEGALEKWLKSEEVPAENDDPVKVRHTSSPHHTQQGGGLCCAAGACCAAGGAGSTPVPCPAACPHLEGGLVMPSGLPHVVQR